MEGHKDGTLSVMDGGIPEEEEVYVIRLLQQVK